MAKDPAFLFYSKDFYEGTRLMTPEERACYIDLLIYQHQNGIIPKDLSRMAQYCSGCSNQMVNQVISQKFILVKDGYINKRLNDEMETRSKAKPKKIASATLAGLISGNKLSKPCATYIKDKFDINQFKDLEENQLKESVKEWFTKWLTKWLTINANEDVNVNTDNNNKEYKTKKKEIVFPFDSENFKTQWAVWKDYKLKEFEFKFKSIGSEQANLTQLSNLAKDEKEAVAIIHQSMANGWKGFFNLKTETHGQQINQNGAGRKFNFTPEQLGLDK